MYIVLKQNEKASHWSSVLDGLLAQLKSSLIYKGTNTITIVSLKISNR